MAEEKVYTTDAIPEDAELFNEKAKEFNPIDPTETYTVEILKAELKDNFFYKPEEKDPKKRGDKYQFSFEYAILDENEFYGRRIWDNAGLYFKPTGKRGATKLFKIVTSALKVNFTWEQSSSFASTLKEFMERLQKEVVGKQLKIAIENVKQENGKIRTKVTTYNPTKVDLAPFDQEKAKLLGDKIRAGAVEKVDPTDIPF